jgi:hypothetical protein
VSIRGFKKLTYDDIKPIGLSFKKTPEDFELYKWILNHSGYSNFIKDKLREAKDAEES